ncbi:Nucleotid_trans domain-containing protein [Durusdinium trenchii]|uniref:Nucleotid_trans domain-containing protein n=1 Tax=Durusdinium trenchii TaxID=1381693 RepID=A0ABP0MCQ0_9DINO
MASLMTLGLAALVLDTDVVLVSDPFQHLTGDADLEVMTDLFFPDMHLLNVSIRPEDHINTGYVYHTATPSALRFMLAFLDAFDAHEWRGFKRDWFNQRAFNKLVLEWVDAGSVKVLYGPGAWCALRGSRTNVGTVARSRQRSCVERTPTSGVTIRVLNPAVIAHGMNFFWRRAHLMRSETGGLPLAAVHANGVEPKDYFLRDRGLWYLDDFTERFGEAPRFFTYVHPRGLSLAEDFEEVAAALEVAMMLQRRLVLPMTMNCRNCPAYGPYGFAEWADKKDLGCTFDYFSRASLAMGEWLKFTVESGVVWLPEFQELLKARRHVSAASLQTELRSAGGRRPAELFGDTAVVQLGEALRVHVLRDLLKQAVRGQPLDSLPCAWRAWPATTFACRDAVLPQVGEEHSGGRDLRASCDGSMQGECGLLPFMCCEAYFGWAEKLEVLGGKTWDLPCGCGLGRHCAQTSRTSDMQVCCEPRVVGARKKFGENCGHNPPVEALPDLVPDDADTYSSSILRELAKGNLAREDAERLCLSFAALHKALGGQEAWSAALHRIAKAADHYQVKGDDRLRSLASKATRELVKWDKLKKPQTMSKIVWAMAKLNLKLHKLVAQAYGVSEEALQKLPEFEPQQLLGLNRVEVVSTERLPLRQLAALDGRIAELAPLGRTNLAWAVAKLQVQSWSIQELGCLETRAGPGEVKDLTVMTKASERNATAPCNDPEAGVRVPQQWQNLANTSWAFATLREADEDFFNAVAKARPMNDTTWSELNARSLLSRSLAVPLIGLRCLQLRAKLNLSNMAWAYAKVQIKRPEMMDAISESVQRVVNDMPAQGVANTVGMPI